MTQDKYPRHLTVRIGKETREFDLTEEHPVAVIQERSYTSWLDDLADVAAAARIEKDVNKMRRGLFGTWKEVDGVYEMKLDYGPGYRVYYGRSGSLVVVLLIGGDKGSQKKDLKKARELWQEIKNEIHQV